MRNENFSQDSYDFQTINEFQSINNMEESLEKSLEKINVIDASNNRMTTNALNTTNNRMTTNVMDITNNRDTNHIPRTTVNSGNTQTLLDVSQQEEEKEISKQSSRIESKKSSHYPFNANNNSQGISDIVDTSNNRMTTNVLNTTNNRMTTNVMDITNNRDTNHIPRTTVNSGNTQTLLDVSQQEEEKEISKQSSRIESKKSSHYPFNANNNSQVMNDIVDTSNNRMTTNVLNTTNNRMTTNVMDITDNRDTNHIPRTTVNSGNTQTLLNITEQQDLIVEKEQSEEIELYFNNNNVDITNIEKLDLSNYSIDQKLSNFVANVPPSGESANNYFNKKKEVLITPQGSVLVPDDAQPRSLYHSSSKTLKMQKQDGPMRDSMFKINIHETSKKSVFRSDNEQEQEVVCEINKLLRDISGRDSSMDQELAISQLYKYINSNEKDLNKLMDSFDKLKKKIVDEIERIEQRYNDAVETAKISGIAHSKPEDEFLTISLSSSAIMNIHDNVHWIGRWILRYNELVNYLFIAYTILEYNYKHHKINKDTYQTLTKFIQFNRETMENTTIANPIIHYIEVSERFQKVLRIPISALSNKSSLHFLDQKLDKNLLPPVDLEKSKITVTFPSLLLTEKKISRWISNMFEHDIQYEDALSYYMYKTLYFNPNTEAQQVLQTLIKEQIFSIYSKINSSNRRLGPNDMEIISPYIMQIIGIIYSTNKEEKNRRFQELLKSLLEDIHFTNNPDLLTNVIDTISVYTNHLAEVFSQYQRLLNVKNYDETQLSTVDYAEKMLDLQIKIQNIDYSAMINEIAKILSTIRDNYETIGENIYKAIDLYLFIDQQQSWYHHDVFKSMLYSNDFSNTKNISDIEKNLQELHKYTKQEIFDDMVLTINKSNHNELICLCESNKIYAFYISKVLLLLDSTEFRQFIKESTNYFDEDIYTNRIKQIKSVYDMYSSFFLNIEYLYALKLLPDMKVNEKAVYYVQYIFDQAVHDGQKEFATPIKKNVREILEKCSNNSDDVIKTLFSFGYNGQFIVNSGIINTINSMLLLTTNYFSILNSYVACWKGLIKEHILIEHYYPTDNNFLSKLKEQNINHASIVAGIYKIYYQYLEELELLQKIPRDKKIEFQTEDLFNLIVNKMHSPILDEKLRSHIYGYINDKVKFLSNIWCIEKKIASMNIFCKNLCKAKENSQTISDPVMNYFIFSNLKEDHYIIIHAYMEYAIRTTIDNQKDSNWELSSLLYSKMNEEVQKLLQFVDHCDQLKLELQNKLDVFYKPHFDKIQKEINILKEYDLENKELPEYTIDFPLNLTDIQKKYEYIILSLKAAVVYVTKVYEALLYGTNTVLDLNDIPQAIIQNNIARKKELENIIRTCDRFKCECAQRWDELCSQYKKEVIRVIDAIEEREKIKKEEEKRLQQEAERVAKMERQRFEKEKKQQNLVKYEKLITDEVLRTIAKEEEENVMALETSSFDIKPEKDVSMAHSNSKLSEKSELLHDNGQEQEQSYADSSVFYRKQNQQSIISKQSVPQSSSKKRKMDLDNSSQYSKNSYNKSKKEKVDFNNSSQYSQHSSFNRRRGDVNLNNSSQYFHEKVDNYQAENQSYLEKSSDYYHNHNYSQYDKESKNYLETSSVMEQVEKKNNLPVKKTTVLDKIKQGALKIFNPSH